jgi:hypothetical protein
MSMKSMPAKRAKRNAPARSIKRPVRAAASFKSWLKQSAAMPSLPAPLERITTTPKGTSEMLNLGLTRIWGLIREGEIEAFHVGRRCLVLVASIHAFAERRAKLERDHPVIGGPASLARARARKSAATPPAA